MALKAELVAKLNVPKLTRFCRFYRKSRRCLITTHRVWRNREQSCEKPSRKRLRDTEFAGLELF
ncbi:MAG: hypothetical protein C4325_02380 [Blastocatellia bacterium]